MGLLLAIITAQFVAIIKLVFDLREARKNDNRDPKTGCFKKAGD